MFCERPWKAQLVIIKLNIIRTSQTCITDYSVVRNKARMQALTDMEKYKHGMPFCGICPSKPEP
jgi:hypothetical protein